MGKIKGEAEEFWAMVREVDAILASLNTDGAFDGQIAEFDQLVKVLPADFFECKLVVEDGSPPGDALVVLTPGPRLIAFATALRALEIMPNASQP